MLYVNSNVIITNKSPDLKKFKVTDLHYFDQLKQEKDSAELEYYYLCVDVFFKHNC